MIDLEDVLASVNISQDSNLTLQVYRCLRRMIISLRLPPHQTLTEKDVAAHLGVSKTPVREAFIRLAEEGLITIVPKSKTYVSPIDLNRFQTGFFVRRNLEIAAARSAAGHRTFEDVCLLKACLARQKEAVAEEDFERFHTEDEVLHQLVFAAAGVGPVWAMVDLAKFELDRVRHLKMRFQIRRSTGVLEEHNAIVDAIDARDAERADQAMANHLGSLEHKIEALTANQEVWRYFELINTPLAQRRKRASG